MVNRIDYLVMSDLHLGHKQNTIKDMVSRLRSYFKTYHKQISNVKIFFIAGDIFDTLLSSSSYEYLLAIEWLTELIEYCRIWNITIRILEGTPSHDWKQAKFIETVVDKLGIDVDFKYIGTLHIEYIAKLGINVLYVPDEYKHDAKDTLAEVKELLKEKNLKQVDIAIMHGAFEHQLPIKLSSSHVANEYLKIVKYYINIGHVHTSSVYGRILAQGSFDRIKHGEEEKKGAMLVTIYSTGDMSYKFLENKLAMGFYTLSMFGKSSEYIIRYLKRKIKIYPKGSHIRILANRDEYLNKSIKELSKEYKDYIIKVDNEKKDKDDTVKLLDYTITEEFISIMPDNIVELITPGLIKRKDEANYDLMMNLLNKTIKEVHGSI